MATTSVEETNPSTTKAGSSSVTGSDTIAARTKPVNPYAVVSLAAGIAALCGTGIPAALIAIVLGHVALVSSQRADERGRGSALVGLVAGYFALVLGVIFLIVVMASTVALVQSFPQLLESFTESLTKSVADSATENLMETIPVP